ncbi:fasciclin domain-containing protein [Salinarimonas sp.]|uniref:fasciclin domain-containing protein n=1 Tax=Salinarimonas sp. TaxID=2766526 RepID=UPI0032D90C70
MKRTVIATAVFAWLGMGAATQAANIVETAQEAGTFGTLLAAAEAAGLAEALATGENLTVFAPTDEAFAALPAGTVESLLQPENRDQLAAILSYHVLPRELASNQLPGRTIHIRTIKQGGDRLLAIAKDAHTGAVVVDGANVVAADIRADNGIIHVIDKVMLPDG